MLPVAMVHPARFSRTALIAALLLGGVLTGTGCATDRETTLSRSSRARAIGELRVERSRQERELAIWRATRAEALAAVDQARSESVEASARLRALRTGLLIELDRLQQGEVDLEAAKVRAAAITHELEPLRALEAHLQDLGQQVAAQQARLPEAEQQLAAATAAAEQAILDLQPRLDAATAKVQALQQAGVLLSEVEQKLQLVREVLTPPAPASAEPPKNEAPKEQ